MIRNIAVANLIMVASSWAFSVGVPSTTRSWQDIVSLNAKKTPSSSKTKATSQSKSLSSGGGFGKVVEIPEKRQDEYSIFPALDAEVEKTILSSPNELLASGALPSEVYDRLDQIYGFPKFNFQNIVTIQESSLSFDELISGSVQTSNSSFQTSTSASSKLSNQEFANLLALATGDESISSSRSPVVDRSTMEAIASLPQFSDFRVLHVDPLVLAVDNFFTDDECNRYIAMSENPPDDTADAAFQTRSKTVGKDTAAQSQRTSTTWFHHYKNVPELMSKASRLLGLDGIDRWEEPQTVRYRRNEKFTWHLDALSPTESLRGAGGQRTATLLVYMTDLQGSDGGATIFRDLSFDSGDRLKVQPKKGSALLFFPAAGGIPNAPFDIRTLHCGEVVDGSAENDKWISQLWLRETPYTPSAPPGNQHELARAAISDYCLKSDS